MPKMSEQRRHSPAVAVVVDNDSRACLEEVARAAKEAWRRQVPLELLQASPSPPMTRLQRARQMQRIDTAVETARDAVPGLEVRLPLCEPPFGEDRTKELGKFRR